jgi:hypothetical protein
MKSIYLSVGGHVEGHVKATRTQSRLKQIERIEVEELVESSRRSPMLRFEPERQSGRDLLDIDGLCIGVIGPNGLGKSTLLAIGTTKLTPAGCTRRSQNSACYCSTDSRRHLRLRHGRARPIGQVGECRAAPAAAQAFHPSCACGNASSASGSARRPQTLLRLSTTSRRAPYAQRRAPPYPAPRRATHP